MRACVGDWKFYVNLTTALIRLLDSSAGAIQREFFSPRSICSESLTHVLCHASTMCSFPSHFLLGGWRGMEQTFITQTSTHLQTFATLSGSKEAQENVKFSQSKALCRVHRKIFNTSTASDPEKYISRAQRAPMSADDALTWKFHPFSTAKMG